MMIKDMISQSLFFKFNQYQYVCYEKVIFQIW
jgi:hypothetical protein